MSRRFTHIVLLCYPEYGAIDVGGESGEQPPRTFEGFVAEGEEILSIKCAQDGLAQVQLTLEEWAGVPDGEPPSWPEWEAESRHEIDIDEYVTVAPAGTQAPDLHGLRLHGGSRRFNVRILAQGRTEIRQRISELARQGQLERAEEFDGIERYLLQIWPANK
ncbi:hypothetical protein ACIBKY_04610 [Nonomuraea sp. NPDC050394]|uniref:hypothetical protein n=1 Tax=Nonomuraea sp. NPDC050394 TaxID=3364363 RepID=UPI0037B7E3DF